MTNREKGIEVLKSLCKDLDNMEVDREAAGYLKVIHAFIDTDWDYCADMEVSEMYNIWKN